MKQCETCKRNFPDHMVFCPFDGEVLEAKEVDPLIGRLVEGKYRIESKIGEGGMGAVYRAKHVMMDNAVAIKVLHATLVADKTAVARFQREAQAAARIKHPNAVTVTDFGVTEDNVIYIVMELFEGQSLREILEKQGLLDLERALEVTKQVCSALEAAHRSGVIHRDVKPDNIVLEDRPGQGEVVKVLDFGIAKLKDAPSTAGNLTRQGVIIGSPHYLSPEQCQSGELDARSDVYSFGIVLYEMLTGEVPFTANTPVAVALKHANEMPRSMRVDHPEIPESVDKVVMRALSKEPERRQQSAMQLAAELEQAVRSVLSAQQGRSTDPGFSPLATKRLDLMPQKELIATASGQLGETSKKTEPPKPPPRSSGSSPAVTSRRSEPNRPLTPTGSEKPSVSITPSSVKRPGATGARPKVEDVSLTPQRTGAHTPVPRAEPGPSPVIYRSTVLNAYEEDKSDDKRRRQIIMGVCVGGGVLLLIIALVWIFAF